MLQATDLTIRLHPDDDVVIARVEIPAGTLIQREGVRTEAAIPAGHKLATRAVEPGKPIRVVSRARVLERADLADQGLRVTGDATAEARSNLPERQRPRHAVIWRAACLPAP